MRTVFIPIGLILLAVAASVQSQVTFRCDLGPLMEKQQFSPQQGHRIYVRGSFNDWQGTACELTGSSGGTVYSGTFDLGGHSGDTVTYKFVIRKDADRFFWEGRPDPDNPDHGNRRLVLTGAPQEVPVARFRPGPYFLYPVIFPGEELEEDFQQFRSILEGTHPALYDYTEKAVLDSLFDLHYAAIREGMDFNSFLINMTEVISRVGCGHSSLWIPGEYWNVAPSGLFPLELKPSGEKYLVSGSFGGSSGIPRGSELISVNGESMAVIGSRLESLTSTDGINRAHRKAMVAKHFAVKYAMAFGFADHFAIQYLPPGQTEPVEGTLEPLDKATIDRGMAHPDELSLKEINGGKTALLTINTFAYYDRVGMFRSFIDSVFQVIDEKGTSQLILDLRGNGGGDPFCSSYLWGYLQHEPLPYFEDHYGRYDTLANPVPLPPLHFQGELFTLIDGACFSTTGHFCGLLKYHRVGKFVGSETGATFTCTGNATYPALDHTGIMVGTARVMRYTAAVKDMDPLHGILPDYPAEPTPEDLAQDRDGVLEFALSLANSSRR